MGVASIPTLCIVQGNVPRNVLTEFTNLCISIYQISLHTISIFAPFFHRCALLVSLGTFSRDISGLERTP